MPTLRMPNINQVALSGYLVQEPDFRFMDNGAARLRGTDRRQPLLSRPQSRRARGDLLSSTSSSGRKPPRPWPNACTRVRQSLSPAACKATLGRDADDQPRFRVQVQVRNLQVLERDAEDMQEETAQEETALRAA